MKNLILLLLFLIGITGHSQEVRFYSNDNVKTDTIFVDDLVIDEPQEDYVLDLLIANIAKANLQGQRQMIQDYLLRSPFRFSRKRVHYLDSVNYHRSMEIDSLNAYIKYLNYKLEQQNGTK